VQHWRGVSDKSNEVMNPLNNFLLERSLCD